MFISFQHAFDATIDLLVAQGRRAIRDDGECFYLSPDGAKCAVGVHIPDGHKAQNVRGGVSYMTMEHPDILEKLDVVGKSKNDVVNFWSLLQSIHDEEEDGVVVLHELKIVADKFEVDTSNARLQLWHDLFR